MAAESPTATETRQFLSSNETRLNKELSSVQHPPNSLQQWRAPSTVRTAHNLTWLLNRDTEKN